MLLFTSLFVLQHEVSEIISPRVIMSEECCSFGVMSQENMHLEYSVKGRGVYLVAQDLETLHRALLKQDNNSLFADNVSMKMKSSQVWMEMFSLAALQNSTPTIKRSSWRVSDVCN